MSSPYAPVPRAPGPRWLVYVAAVIAAVICALWAVHGWHVIQRQNTEVGGIKVGAGAGDYFAFVAPIVIGLLAVYALIGHVTSFARGAVVSRLIGIPRRTPLTALTSVQLVPQNVPRQKYKFRAPIVIMTGRSGRKFNAQRYNAPDVCRFLDHEVALRPQLLADDFTRERWAMWADTRVSDAERQPFWDPRTVPLK